MMRQRRGAHVEEDSSSDEEDAFAKLAKKGGGKKKKASLTSDTPKTHSDDKNPKSGEEVKVALPVSTTSSMKRHHVTSNDSRKAKMDALLQELEEEKSRVPITQECGRGFVPEKKGSFVDPEEEHLTTNIFVGKDIRLPSKLYQKFWRPE